MSAEQPARSAAEVSRVLRKAGVPVGYRYTQTGYVDRDRQDVTEPGCEVTRNRKARYGGTEDRGHVGVFLVDPSGRDVPDEFKDRVERALRDGGLPLGRVSSLMIEVLDPHEHEFRCVACGAPAPTG